MVNIGYFLSSEERGPGDLLDGAQAAEQAGFRSLWLSDHYHPWTDEGGQSPFIWTVLGAIAATTDVDVTTAVTCPTVRIHPAVVAQAAATVAALAEAKSGRRRFALGVGSGEALNEHILGDAWPATPVRLEMLEEAVAVMRQLWTGEWTSMQGKHYTVDRARLYTLPRETPLVYLSGFGPKATSLAARIADGFMNVQPDADAVRQYREEGGSGVTQAGVKVAWAPTAEQGLDNAHRLWRHQLLPGDAAQILPQPQEFAALGSLVTRDAVAEAITCGPDPGEHLQAIQAYVDAGYDEVYVSQIGPDQQGMLDFYAREVLPHLA